MFFSLLGEDEGDLNHDAEQAGSEVEGEADEVVLGFLSAMNESDSDDTGLFLVPRLELN
jgi:hypothetical protein